MTSAQEVGNVRRLGVTCCFSEFLGWSVTIYVRTRYCKSLGFLSFDTSMALLGVGNSNIFNFHPENWRKFHPIWQNAPIFQMGRGKTHQPGTMDFDQISGCLFSTTPPSYDMCPCCRGEGVQTRQELEKALYATGAGPRGKKSIGIMTQFFFRSENHDCTI